MLEISEIMPDKSSVNIDLGQLDFDENTIDVVDENHNHFISPQKPPVNGHQYRERRRTFRQTSTTAAKH